MPDEEWAPPAPARPRAAPDVRRAAPGSEVVVPGYTDLVEIARGGDSIVYQARQASLDRDVAIKVVALTDPSTVERFQRELAITVRLGRAHPHVVTVLDTTTTTAGEPCLIMDFHDLGSLHDRLVAQGPLSASEVVEAGTAVADALAFAHAAGVLHRDVKPQNILVLPTSYVLSDFGIARREDADRTASLERFSYRHASPQVLDGMTPTGADDVWSLGSTLFTLLDGRAPFSSDDPDDDTALAYLRRVRLNERRPLRRDDLPTGLREVVEACLTPDRDERTVTAEQALGMLRSIRTEGRSWEPDAGAAAAPLPVTPPEVPASATPEAPSPADDAGSLPQPAPAMSRSTLADLEPVQAIVRPGQPDDEATGALTETQAEEPGSAPRSPRSHGWRRTALFLSGMLLVGAAVGITTALVQANTAPDPATSTAPTEHTVPSAPPPSSGTDDPQATVSNPAFAPRDLVIVDQGTSALLTWAAPTHDVTSLAVIRFEGDDTPEVVVNLAPSATEYTVEGLDPDGESCFAVAGYGKEDGRIAAGSTPKECTG